MNDDDEKRRVDRLIAKTIKETLAAMPSPEPKMIGNPAASPSHQPSDDDGQKVLNLRAMLEQNLNADISRERAGGGEGGNPMQRDIRRLDQKRDNEAWEDDR